jgi:16S rRNA (cytosine1402-N4)-methyltransferase
MMASYGTVFGGIEHSILMRHNMEEGSTRGPAHIPVLWREVLELIGDVLGEGEGIVVDCTIGEGGHAELLLEHFENIRLIGFERDEEILELARKRLRVHHRRIELINDNFSNISVHLKKRIGRISSFLYDLGISSFHLDRSGRGFSFRDDEPLDMRLDSKTGLDARYVVNNYSQERLAEIFYRYGEERWSKKIARYIVQRRGEKSIDTSRELAELILRAIPRKFQVKNIHPATRVFQALRIVVNNELESIESSLRDAVELLSPGGRAIAISFHSLEDRIVKNIFRRMARGCSCREEICQCEGKPVVKILTKKPIVPGRDEIEQNRRARSAKLRACEKIASSEGRMQ